MEFSTLTWQLVINVKETALCTNKVCAGTNPSEVRVLILKSRLFNFYPDCFKKIFFIFRSPVKKISRLENQVDEI